MTSTTPHYVREYRRYVSRLLKRKDLDPDQYDAAMARSVGGAYEAVGEAERSALLSLGLKSGHHVVDVGCGSGRLATALHRSGPTVDYLGTDVVPDLLAYARQRCAGRDSWRFVLVEDLVIPENDATADFVVFFSVFTHLYGNECLALLKEARRVLKPDGRIVVSYLDPAKIRWSYLLLFLASQAAYLVFDRGAKGVLSSRTSMTRLARRAGLDVAFSPLSSMGQSLCVFTAPASGPPHP